MLPYFKVERNFPKRHAQCIHALILTQCRSLLLDDHCYLQNAEFKKYENLGQNFLIFFRSVYFTENSGYRSLKNRSCVTVFGSCSATLTVGEPLGYVSGYANHDFRTSVTEISGEIAAFFFFFSLPTGIVIFSQI